MNFLISKSYLIMKHAIFLSVILFAIGCSEDKELSLSEVAIPVTIASVNDSKISSPVLTSGKISSPEEAILSFKTGGVLEAINVSDGKKVAKGTLLAKLNLSEIQAKVTQAKSAHNKAERDLIRVTSLYKDSVVTLEQFQNVQTAYEMAKSNLDIASFNLKFSMINAPSDGIVYNKFVEENEIVGPGTPIFKFGSTTGKWQIEAGVTDKDINKISIGTKAIISLDSNPDLEIKAVITEIAGASNPYTSTYNIKLDIETEIKNLMSGMICKVKIIPESKILYKTIPLKSLVNADDMSGNVFTVSLKDSVVTQINVKIKEILDHMVIVDSGLEGISNVVVDGVEYISDGSKVRIVKLGAVK